MTLGNDFPKQYVVLKARRVRTPEGAKFFHLPIGAIITGGAVDRARRIHGQRAVEDVMIVEQGLKPNEGLFRKTEPVDKAISPGGRPADDSPLAEPGYKGPRRLVNYIREVAHALIRKGTPKSKAIGMAHGIVKNWAEGKGHVSPKVRAAAAKAIAEQQALDTKNRVVKTDRSKWNLSDYLDIVKQLEADDVAGRI